LFIISGKVKNEFSVNVKSVKVTGKLFSPDKKLVKTEFAYCGNTLKEDELTSLNLKAIQDRLMKKAGPQITPGKVIPYILVFSKVPDNVEDFTVEVSETILAQ
jgi:hypothetical protein